MVNEADKYKEEDTKRKERIEAKNQYENMLYGTKNGMDKFPESSRTNIQDFLNTEFAWLEKQNVDTTTEVFNEKSEAFKSHLSVLSQEVPSSNPTPNPDIADVD